MLVGLAPSALLQAEQQCSLQKEETYLHVISRNLLVSKRNIWQQGNTKRTALKSAHYQTLYDRIGSTKRTDVSSGTSEIPDYGSSNKIVFLIHSLKAEVERRLMNTVPALHVINVFTLKQV